MWTFFAGVDNIYTGATEWFLRLTDGRPLDVTVGPDGGLYVADYDQSMIYRIVYGAPMLYSPH